MAPYAYTSVLTPSSREKSKAACYKEYPHFFSSAVQDVDCTQDLDLAAVACDLSAQADHWDSRGSGFVLEHISKFVLCISKYQPLHGSTFIPTPPWLSKKKCVVNVKNFEMLCVFCVGGFAPWCT